MAVCGLDHDLLFATVHSPVSHSDFLSSMPSSKTLATAEATPASEEHWDLLIQPHTRWWDLHLDDVWRYRDLLWMFVRRDFVSVYKQTILGPVWFFIQPLLTTLVFTVIFSGVARISTDGHPALLFYLAGTTPWNYFAACLNKTSNTFVANAGIFGKVYFPRLIVPLSVVASNIIQYGIQFLLFLALLAYYLATGAALAPHWGLLLVLTPALILLMAGLGLGAGIIVSSLTTKYRDFTHLIAFGIQLLMYATPIIYPLNALPEKWRWLVELNPMCGPIEAFRALYLGGPIPWTSLGFSAAVTAVLLLLGVVIFNKVEKTFMDTV
jgi:lipopolysaccharide transport system permease protein